MGGTVAVESIVGQGTCFSLRFPLVRNSTEQITAKQAIVRLATAPLFEREITTENCVGGIVGDTLGCAICRVSRGRPSISAPAYARSYPVLP